MEFILHQYFIWYYMGIMSSEMMKTKLLHM